MNKREKIIGVALLIVGLIWFMTIRAQTVSGKKAPANLGPQEEAAPAGSGDVLAAADMNHILEKISWRFHEARTSNEILDPFQKFDAKDFMDKRALDLSELKLKGILFERGLPVALINDQILRPGDMIAGFEVTEIQDNEVILKRGLEKHTLRLFEEP